MEGRRSAGAAPIQRAREACAPHRHAAVGLDRRGRGGPDAVQPRSECACACWVRMRRVLSALKRQRLTKAISGKAMFQHRNGRTDITETAKRL
jgi:hypothetical protein